LVKLHKQLGKVTQGFTQNYFCGEEHGGDDSEGDNEGSKGEGGRSYKDDNNEGHDGTFPKGGGRRWSSSGGKGTQQSNAKATSTERNMVAMTARATMKAARATMAAMMTPNGQRHRGRQQQKQ
jgi:hypothetical protein